MRKKTAWETSEKQKDDKSIAQNGRECKRKTKETSGMAYKIKEKTAKEALFGDF